MKKEVLLAIIIGLIFGLVITFGIYQANRYAKPVVQNDNSPTPTSTTTEQESLITLISPSDGDIFNNSTATISGNVKPGTLITILSETQEFFVNTTNNQFSQEIKLNSGANLIEVIGITPQGSRQDIKLNLVFTTANLTPKDE